MAQRLVNVMVRLARTKPAVWRELQMVSRSTLADLHAAIQAAMPWQDYHLHRFEIADDCYVDADCDWEDWGDVEMRDEQSVTLGSLLCRGVVSFRYIYDFGDDWEHEIRIARAGSAMPDIRYPHVTGGKRACPPEDCGGAIGHARLLEAIALRDDPPSEGEDDADPEPEYADEMAELLEWARGFDPGRFDIRDAQSRVDAVFGVEPLDAEMTALLTPRALGLSRPSWRLGGIAGFDSALADDAFEQAEFVNTAAVFLKALAEEPAPATSAGYINVSDARRLGALLGADERHLAYAQTELEIPALDSLRQLLMMASLVANRAGVFVATPLGRTLIQPGWRASLAASLFSTYWEEFNPAYADRLGETPRLQSEFVSTLGRVLARAARWATAQEIFASALSDPVKLELVFVGARWRTGVEVLEGRLLASLAEFGLLEKGVLRGDSEVARYRTTSLADAWIAFEAAPKVHAPVENPTAHEVLQEFLAQTTAQSKQENIPFDSSAELLESYLSGYGHDVLPDDKARMWEQTRRESDDVSFCEVFGPAYLGEALPMFLSWFVPRKVMIDRAGLTSLAHFGEALAQWLVARGLMASSERIEEIARELPLAAVLDELLSDWIDAHGDLFDEGDCVEGEFQIIAVGQSSITLVDFFDGTEYGESPVPPAIARAARVGMQFSGMLLAERGVWRIVEVWTVYPG